MGELLFRQSSMCDFPFLKIRVIWSDVPFCCEWFEFLSVQPGLRVTPGKWSTRQTAGGSSADKLAQLWSESPDQRNMVSAEYASLKPLTCRLSCLSHIIMGITVTQRHDYETGQMIVFFSVLTQQEEASSVLFQHPEMRQSSGAAGVSVSHHTGQKHFCLFFIFTMTLRPSWQLH